MQEIDRLMAVQEGVVCRRQARAAGMAARSIDRRLESGVWIKVLPGVYRISSSAPNWRQFLTAAWLWAGEDAVVSHRAAALLHGLDGVDEAPAELWTGNHTLAPKHRGWIVTHTTSGIPRTDLARAGPLVVTNPARTLIDLGAVVGEGIVEFALEDALRRGLTTIGKIESRLADLGGSGRRGAGVLRNVLSRRGAGAAPAGSGLEVKLIRILRSAKLADPMRQYPIRIHGKVVARPDLAYPASRLLIECDGYKFHSGRNVFDKDRGRRNVLAALGWTVLHFTRTDVANPSAFLEALKAVLSSNSVAESR